MGLRQRMRFFAPAAAAIFSAAFTLPVSAAPAAPETFPGAPGVITLSGKCAKLVVAKFDATKGCKNELASVTLANGLVTFIFTSDGKALGFQGDGAGIKPASNGNARLPLSLVTTGVGNKMTGEVKVAGFCTFGNPYSGKPIAIECTAESKDSSFTGSFRTGGKLVKKGK
ncbi:hypothetical protein EEQ99_16125 [Rhizobium anhuiense]|uniref:Tat pathway signal sequence domain protein n=2 Tax=Rhizobium/Agrobacterium group TaxID=227290 RepID=A0A3S0QBH7_9HYPH|nr:hypothetical protein EEQ99_16125 [Rhizobium anhuiense]